MENALALTLTATILITLSILRYKIMSIVKKPKKNEDEKTQTGNQPNNGNC